ncbi:MAG: hypothetical protein ABIT83_17845, partial [Massilia sp.]
MINSRLPARLAVLSVFASAGAFAFAAMPSGATPVVTPVSTPPVAIDFSFAGFGAGGVGLPLGAPSLLVSPSGADDTALLQAAIDQVGALPAGADGTRGVLLLAPGLFRVNGQLRMRSEGVVLRGSGRQATTLLASGQSRRTLIMAGGDQAPGAGAAVEVTDQLVPAGGRVLHLASTQGLRVGARVIVRRPSTKAWIDSLGMSSLPGTFAELRYHWPAGSRDLVWDRTVSAIDAASGAVTLDAPVTTALEQRFGGATVALLAAHAPLRRIGIENLVIDSDFARAGDEEHAWGGIALDNVEDAWVRDVTGRHLVSTLVKVGPRGRRVSIERVRSEQPVSELGGYRRVSFQIEGQQVLVRDCSADAGLNDFASGLLAAGPNVFLDSQASHAQGASGAYESWASGVLYENVRIEGAPLRLRYDTTRVQAAGWTAANSVIWNSRASELSAQGPDGAPNLLVRSASPLYLRQLAQRLGAAAAQLP